MYVYRPRIHRPEKGNRYYNNAGHGGINPCIDGKPMQDGLTVLNNCVGYAVGRYAEAAEAAKCILESTNAENFLAVAKKKGIPVSTLPHVGGILVWSKGKIGNGDDGAGHVAFVERMITENRLVTSESGWNTYTWKLKKRLKSKGVNGNWGESGAYKYIGCIINPAVVNPFPRPVITLKRGMRGDAIKWLQWQLTACGYNLDIDGSFGSLTESAVKCFQRDRSALIDGVAGRITKQLLTVGFWLDPEDLTDVRG